MLHISQLSRDTIDDPHEVISEGETHLLRVISLDSDRQRIGLSLRSVTASEQIEWMSQKELEAAEEEAAIEEVPTDVDSEVLETSQELEIQAIIDEAEETATIGQKMMSIASGEEE